MANEDAASAKPLTKTEVLNTLVERTGLSKKDVNTVFDELSGLIKENLSDGGPGVFSIPNLLKIKVVRKPATPEREGIDPFTKQPKTFKAKPAKNVVKAQPLKALKDMV